MAHPDFKSGWQGFASPTREVAKQYLSERPNPLSVTLKKQNNMSPKAQTCLPFIVCLLLFAQCGGSKRDDATLRFFQRGNIEMKKGNTPEAIRLYTEAIEADRDYADAYNNRGVAYIKYGDAEKAAADFDRAIQLAPDYTDAYFNRAQAYEKAGQLDKSLKDLDRVAGLFKDSSKVFLSRALVKTQLNDYVNALPDFDRAIALDPRSAEAYVNRGVVRYGLRKYAEAENDFNKALQLQPNQDFALNNLAQLRIREKKYADALVLLDKAIALNPNQPYYRNNRGFVKMQLGQTEAGGAEVRQSLAADAKNGWAHRNLGVYWLLKQNPAEALASLQQASNLTANIELLHYYKGLAHSSLGDNAAACREWKLSASLGETESAPLLQANCR